MAVKRGPDGVPVDVPSVMHEKDRKNQQQDSGSSEDATIPPASGKSSGLFPDEPATVPAGESARQEAAKADRDDPKTVIAGGAARKAAREEAEGHQAPATDPMSDPVVGWLVVIDGPGKGQFLRLGHGQNSIGRGNDQRVSLDFGDDQISRNNHAVLTYDPRGKQYYIQQGAGANLAYLDDKPVLAPTELPERSRVTLGETTLLFVPLCGEDFSW